MTLQELFSDESKWTKRACARDRTGQIIGHSDRQATCWCLLGGMMVCYPYTYNGPRKMFNDTHGIDIPIFNDSPHTTFKDIQEVAKEIDLWMSQQST